MRESNIHLCRSGRPPGVTLGFLLDYELTKVQSWLALVTIHSYEVRQVVNYSHISQRKIQRIAKSVADTFVTTLFVYRVTPPWKFYS